MKKSVFSDEIRGLAKAVVSDSPKSVAKTIERGGSGDVRDDAQPEREPPSREWMRVRALLNFMEVFDKLMYNAYEGAVFSIAPVSKVSIRFACPLLLHQCSGCLTITYFVLIMHSW